MQLIDVKFDSNQGDANAALDQGIIKITLTDSNPNFPTGAQINIPLDSLFAAVKAKVNNTLVGWALSGVQALLDAIP